MDLPLSPFAPHRRVIVVDDDPSVRDALQFALELDGFRVLTFHSAESLLAGQDADDADCLVIDYRLSGLNGLELLEILRRRAVLAPAILMTTQPAPALRRSAALAGTPIVEKPLLGDTLSAAIQAALSRDAATGRRPRQN